MVNGELIRVNSAENINLKGHIVKLHLKSKVEENQWTTITAGLLKAIQNGLKNKESSSRVKLLQSNLHDKCTVYVPEDEALDSISSVMSVCLAHCQELKSAPGVEADFIVLKTDLEQTFLAYASHQKNNDAARN
jgi:ribosomal protein S26